MGGKSPQAKPVNQVLSEALNFFMEPYWSNVSLARASGVAEGTIRNYRSAERAGTSKSGKAPSAKLTELEKVSTAMGLQVADLVTEMSVEARGALYRKRAAECYERTGSLPPWAPSAPPPGGEASTQAAPRKRASNER